MRSDLFENFLDFLIPQDAGVSEAGSSVWGQSNDRAMLKNRVLKLFEDEFSQVDDKMDEILIRLRTDYSELFTAVTNALLEDYFSHPSTRLSLGQLSSPFPLGYTLPKTDWVILEPVFIKASSRESK